MSAARIRGLTIALCAAIVFSVPACWAEAVDQQTEQTASPAAISRRVGTIKSISGAVITMTPDSGPEINLTVEDATRIRRIAPGETNPKNATPLEFRDLQVGDLIRVNGIASDDGKSIIASSILALKASDIEARKEQELQDWQKRGVDGLASAVDAAGGTITISARGKKVVVHASQTTVMRRYAPDSVKFEDAKPGTLQEVHSGDQVRARGERSLDGSELVADEIVSGSFPSIAGTVSSVDASASTLSVHDLLARKTVVVKITPDSQLRNLPPEMAQRIAMVLKGGLGGATQGQSAANGSGSPGDSQGARPAGPPGEMPPEGMVPAGMAKGGRPGGAPDFQRVLMRAPPTSLADLHKGDAVLILSTAGSTGIGTVITLLSGVEPILRAAPGASSASILTPWSLSAPSGDAGGP